MCQEKLSREVIKRSHQGKSSWEELNSNHKKWLSRKVVKRSHQEKLSREVFKKSCQEMLSKKLSREVIKRSHQDNLSRKVIEKPSRRCQVINKTLWSHQYFGGFQEAKNMKYYLNLLTGEKSWKPQSTFTLTLNKYEFTFHFNRNWMQLMQKCNCDYYL